MPQDQPVRSTPQPESAKTRALVYLALLGILAISHGAAIFDGPFFDDHWHRVTLRQAGWTLNDLTESATFTLDPPNEPSPKRFDESLTNLWWQTQPLHWRYARFVAMFFMKIEQTLCNESSVGMHAFGLLWHLATAVLIFHLARYAILSTHWAFFSSALFIINPHSVFAVSWLASQNAVMSGCFFVAAVLAYANASLSKQHQQHCAIKPRYLFIAVILWALALFSREAAVCWPAVIFMLDFSLGDKKLLRKRLPIHAGLWIITLVYLYWRLRIFPASGPPNIYFTAPTDLTYIPWAFSKLLQMLFALTFYTPMFLGLSTYGAQTGTQAVVHVFMLVFVAAAYAWYIWASRIKRGRLLWPTWVLVALLPVIPVFITPHFSYLPFAAYAIMAGISLSRLPHLPKKIVTALVIAATLWSLGVYRFLWRGIIQSEQLIYADIIATTPPPQPGRKLFFINLPITGIYAPVALRDIWQTRDLEGYVLTFAPHPIGMYQSCIVEQLNDHELEISTEPAGYFSGLTGSMLLDGMRPDNPLTPGTTIQDELFDTAIIEANDHGITRLRFTFHKPLASEDYYFYVSSTRRPAYRKRFNIEPAHIASEHAQLFAQARAENPHARSQARGQLAQLTRYIAAIPADPIQQTLQADLHAQSDATLDQIETWWKNANASEILEDDRQWREANHWRLQKRNYYDIIMETTANIIQSDLLLTND